jgi:tetratricopeptide (TPR) repeat protein
MYRGEEMGQIPTNESQAPNVEPEIFAHPDITAGTMVYGIVFKIQQNYRKPHKPETAHDYLNRGVEYYIKSDNKNAIKDFDKAIALIPDFAEAYNDRGLCFIYEGDMDRAISDFDRAIQLKTNFYIAYCNRGTAYKSEYKIDQAFKDYSQTILLKPDFAPAYNNRGDVYRMGGELDLAISDYDIRDLAYFDKWQLGQNDSATPW